MFKNKNQPPPLTQPLSPNSPPEKQDAPVAQLVVSITADAEILEKVPTLARECKTMLFTSSPQCESMEEWQRIFEANGFRFLRNTNEPTIRSMLFESLHYG